MIRRFSVLGVLGDHTNKLISNIDLDGVGLAGPGFDLDRVQAEKRTEVFLDAQDFSLVHDT